MSNNNNKTYIFKNVFYRAPDVQKTKLDLILQ